MKCQSTYAYRFVVTLTMHVLVLWDIRGILCCQNDPSLYFIDDHRIKCAAVESLEKSNPAFQTVVSNIAEGTAIDMDVRNRMVYWSDTQAWTINRMNLTSGEVKAIIKDNIGEVYSMAVEWESGLIYWTDFIYERIEVANVNGSSRKTLVTQNVKSPIGIAVDPRNGYMVWSDHDYAAPRIMRADLTGENPKVLFKLFHGLPFYVIINYSENRVYWTDIHFLYTFIGSVGLDGKSFQGLRYIKPVHFPFDLAIFENHFYWADENLRGVSWFEFKNKSSSVTTLRRLSPHYLLGVVISDPSTQPMAAGQQPCAVNNGNCSDLCLLTPGRGRKCACPQGVALNGDGMTCANESAPATQSPPLPAIKVRLRGSSVPSRGRVEVLYNGQWGTICDDYWGKDEAHVICRMLNYSGAEFALRNAFFGRGERSMPILLDNVKCRGDESTIAACRHGGWRQNDCDHSEDASVVCWSESASPGQEPTLAPGPHPELKVKLHGGDAHYKGGVEIYLNGTWGTICDDSWGIEEANVICRMLNFTEGALSTQCCGFYNNYGVAEKIWLDDVHCVGDEQSIAECRHRGWGRHNCRHSEDVGVVCKHSPISTPDQIVRLADGARENEGRVEIFNDGEWGTVCDDHWDMNDANVVCKMLNYSRTLRAPGQAFFGRGNGKIWLNSLNCRGDETSILKCEYQGWNVDSCDHHEDASVICEREPAHLESNSFILACGSGRSLIYHIPLDSSLLEKGVPLPLQTYKPLAITFHSVEKMAYWTEQSGSIIRAYLNGSSREVIAMGLTRPSGIAIDYIGQNLYFTDQNGIKVSRLNGSYQVTLIDLVFCHGIALDSEAGYMYFTLIGANPQILRADMDGGNRVVLLNVSSIRRTTLDITLDKVNKRLYYSDESNNLIKYLDLVSFMSHSVLFGNPRRPVGLTLFKGTLYWTGVGAAETFSGAVYKADANNVNGSIVREVEDLISYPNGLYAHDSGASESPGYNHSCAKDNGRCSHLCLLNPTGYSCVCPAGPCQTAFTSSASTTSSANRVTMTSISTSMHTTVNSKETRASISVSSSSSILSASVTSSLASASSSTPYVSMAIFPTSSKVNFLPTQLAPTKTSFVNSISTATPPITDYCSTHDPCENEGICQVDGLSYKCVCTEYFIGQHCSIHISGGAVVIVINIPGNQLNKRELIHVIVKILNNLCASGRCPLPLSEGARRRREISKVTFKPEDVVVLEPKQVDENLQVDLAVVKIMPDGSFVIISSDNLTKILLDAAAEIGQRLGGTVLSVKPKFPGPTTPTPPVPGTNRTQPISEKTTIATQTSPVVNTAEPGTTTQAPVGPGQAAASKGGSSGGVIGGVVVAVLVIIILVIALAVWYFRVKLPGPFSYKRNTDVPGPRVAAFENPGYDNASEFGIGTADGGLYEDLPPPVVLSPYEDLSEFGAVSNPTYSEFGLEKLSVLDANRTGLARSSNVSTNRFGALPKVSRVGNDDDNENDASRQVSSQKSDAIQRVKTSQETGNKESGMLSEAGIGKGQALLVLEPGDELKNVSEM